MNTLGSMCYVCTKEICHLMDGLLEVIRNYISEHILVEKFAHSIEEVIASIYYSGIASSLPSEQIIKILDTLMQIGWRNAYYTSEQQVPPLIIYLKNKSAFSLRDSINNRIEASLDELQYAKQVEDKISQLTFPAGKTGKKLIDDMDFQLKGRVKNANVYFSYQHESNIVMHETTENIAHFFIYLDKALQIEILPYFARISAFETRNEQSPILQQTLILYDLINWFANTNIERMSNEILQYNLGKLWLINSSLLHVASDKEKIWVKTRNIVSTSVFQLNVKNIQPKIQQKSQNVLPIIQELQFSSKKDDLKETNDIHRKEENDISMNPENLFSFLPYSLYNRQYEKLLGWEPVKINKELQNLLQNLDTTEVHNIHSIGVVYIPPKSK